MIEHIVAFVTLKLWPIAWRSWSRPTRQKGAWYFFSLFSCLYFLYSFDLWRSLREIWSALLWTPKTPLLIEGSQKNRRCMFGHRPSHWWRWKGEWGCSGTSNFPSQSTAHLLILAIRRENYLKNTLFLLKLYFFTKHLDLRQKCRIFNSL